MTEGHFTRSSHTFYYQHHTIDNPKALIVMVHGISEHALRYTSWIARLLNAGFNVAIFDLQGHGQTTGKRGTISSYEDLLEDIAYFVDFSRKRIDVPCTFLYGQSLGGNLVLSTMLKTSCDVDGIIATSPMFRTAFKVPWYKIILGNWLKNIAPNMRVPNGLDYLKLTHNIDVLKALKTDTLVHPWVSARLGNSMLEYGAWLLSTHQQLKVPTLILHSKADAITSHQASSEFCAHQAKARCIIYDDFYHELQHEPDNSIVLEDIQAFISEVCH